MKIALWFILLLAGAAFATAVYRILPGECDVLQLESAAVPGTKWLVASELVSCGVFHTRIRIVVEDTEHGRRRVLLDDLTHTVQPQIAIDGPGAVSVELPEPGGDRPEGFERVHARLLLKVQFDP